MAIDILVPPLSQTMDTVVLVEWLKTPGSQVTKGEPLYTIETDKATLEVEAPASGVLQETLVKPGAEVKVHARIGSIAAPGEASAPPGPASGPAAAGQASGGEPALVEPAGPAPAPGRAGRVFSSPRARKRAEAEQVNLEKVRPTGPQGAVIERDVLAYLDTRRAADVRATPVARRMADEAGLDLSAIAPSDPGSRITRADVEAAVALRALGVAIPASPPATGEGAGAGVVVDGEPLSITRRTIARRMAESWRNAPQVTLTREVDATELVLLRKRIAADVPAGASLPSYTAFLVAITARCLARTPGLNGTTDGERILLSPEVHLAVAVDTVRGLVAPVIHHADRKGILELSPELDRVVARALDGSAGAEDYAGGTFTLSNLGPAGIDAFTPIINPPQIAILGVGRIQPRPAVYEGEIRIREMLYLSLTFDHRAVDGGPAARFLGEVARLIEKPHLIWL